MSLRPLPRSRPPQPRERGAALFVVLVLLLVLAWIGISGFAPPAST